MKRFVFSLETLLKVRTQHEEIAKRDFGLARADQIEQESYLSHLADEKEAAHIELLRLGKGTMEVRTLLLFQKYFSGLEDRKERGLGRLVELIKVTDDMREKLVEVRRLKRVVELLREKQYKRYLREADREEQLMLDDITSMREARKVIGYEV